MSAFERHVLSQCQWLAKQSHTVANVQVMSTRAQQHEKSKLSLNLSFLEEGPWRVVPLIERMIVSLSEDTKTCPLKPSAVSSQPNGKLYNVA